MHRADRKAGYLSSAVPAQLQGTPLYVRLMSRGERADNAMMAISSRFEPKQQAFLNFVLSQYVKVDVEELDQEKLTPLLKLKHHDAIEDAIAELGDPQKILGAFTSFQKFLYQQAG
jgi:type I restriction enzyme R subunit